MQLKGKYLLLVISLCCTVSLLQAQITYSGEQPGEAMLASDAHRFTLENKVLGISFSDLNGKLSVLFFQDKKSGSTLTLQKNAPLFTLTTTGGRVLTSADFTVKKNMAADDIAGKPDAVIFAKRMNAKRISASLENAKLGLTIDWEAELRDGSNYIRQILKFSPKDSANISKITMISLPAASNAKPVGIVDGSPMVVGNMFFAVEHPQSRLEKNASFSSAFLARSLPLTAERPLTLSAVWGVTPAKQLRRGFLYYVERERANPYHQFLHYNSWFDLSFADRVLNDSLCLDRVKVFGDSLITKRNVRMDAFLFDDGWDDYKTLWQFNKGFPNGFTNVRNAAAKLNAGIGVWMSPWGGYDIRKPQRLEYGAKQHPPFETNENGFSLAGPVYFKRFSDVTSDFITKYNVSIFKFDGVGAGNGVNGVNGKYERDVEAFLRLTRQIRDLKPDIFLSLTIGTWPSVYWLNYGDAIWRAGDDTGIRGKGTKRQQWINYRDAQTYQNVVKRAPLYPISSLMLHGLCIADAGIPGKFEMDNDQIADEMWSFFGSGTSLEEMYVNPHKLNSQNWDCLRNVITWARANASIMPDAHWIGGDPAKEEVYGFAGWSSKGGFLTIRNPSDQVKTYHVKTREVFDLPEGTGTRFRFEDARAKAEGKTNTAVASGDSFDLTLQPFEVKVLDAVSINN